MERNVQKSRDAFELQFAIEQANPVDWLSPWVSVELSDDRTDFKRFGRSQVDGKPGFAQIIVYQGVAVEHQAWRGLVDEEQLQKCLSELPA